MNQWVCHYYSYMVLLFFSIDSLQWATLSPVCMHIAIVTPHRSMLIQLTTKVADIAGKDKLDDPDQQVVKKWVVCWGTTPSLFLHVHHGQRRQQQVTAEKGGKEAGRQEIECHHHSYLRWHWRWRWWQVATTLIMFQVSVIPGAQTVTPASLRRRGAACSALAAAAGNSSTMIGTPLAGLHTITIIIYGNNNRWFLSTRGGMSLYTCMQGQVCCYSGDN